MPDGSVGYCDRYVPPFHPNHHYVRIIESYPFPLFTAKRGGIRHIASETILPGQICAEFPCEVIHPGLCHSEYVTSFEHRE